MKTTNRLAVLMTALSIGVSFAAITPASAQDTQVIPKSGTTRDSKPSTSEQQPQSGTSTKDLKGNSDNSPGQAPAQSTQGNQDSQSNGSQNNSSTNTGATGQTGSQSGDQTQEGNGTKAGTNKKSASPQSRGTNSSNDEQGTGQGGTDTNKAGSAGSSGSNMKAPSGTKQDQQTDTTGGETGSKTTTKTNTQGGSQVQVSVEQQTQIRQVVKEVHVTPVRETDFSVSVGATIPRKIELEPLPPRIVQIVPQYKAYRFFVLADGRIVIVDPSTFTIVYIIDA
ncbi:hypothetical protein RsS62_00810 [Rhizobium dioscoreae]|uniref:DUF1236 domain-containing protein n=1 Tax=Rhizobium dioscoreae TaxID=2653122 RepID=UPI001260DB3B|nr:DUF1236 domain-containing protein [Rhizobium dioscoreae]GES40829.1 hypothetical protein RsS62_00810 [Rhizobium dioscoreae]